MKQIRQLSLQTRRDAWVEIDLSALEHNVQLIQAALPVKTGILAIVKADAYGHGAGMVLPTLQAYGVTMAGVAAMDEAIQIRHAGIEMPILVIGAIPDWAMQVAADYDIQLTVFAEHHRESLRRVYQVTGEPVKVHIKIDTGMHRIGIDWRTALPFIRSCLHTPYMQVEGIFTHLACAEDAEFSRIQHERFQSLLRELYALEGYLPPYIHLANSVGAFAGHINNPDTSQKENPNDIFDYNMVRLGIALFGYLPESISTMQLQPVLGLKGRIIHLQEMPAGEGVSYNRTYVPDKNVIIATVPIGYADGVFRALSNRIVGLIDGHRVPQVGNITMDQMMFDVTDLPSVRIGDTITLIGTDQIRPENRVTLTDWAKAANTIEYELMCSLRVRLPKTYSRH